jgi:hypothetical protein
MSTHLDPAGLARGETRVQEFYGRKRREPGGLGHYRPAHYPGGGSEHRGTGRTETVEQGAAGKEEHHCLGCDR